MADKSIKRIQFQMRIKEASINMPDNTELVVLWVRGINSKLRNYINLF